MEMGYSFDRSRVITKFSELLSATKSEDISDIAKTIAVDFSLDPFIKQEELAKKYNLSVADLKQVNDEIKANKEVIDLIVNHGPASAYWQNTILPLLESKHFKAMLNNEFIYPQLIGLHMGMSCMFRCHFCPRNHDVRYDKDLAEKSLELVKSLFDQAPKDNPNWATRFGLSGGHEPLTNPYLADMIDYGADLGYKLRLYTNGYMLTPQLMSKKPGLRRLQAIRVSLYGVDDETYDSNTRTVGGWETVCRNIYGSLTDLKVKKSNTKLGINWIILPGQAHLLPKLFDQIKSWNKHGNGISFVTLRENYSPDQMELAESEKNMLIEFFDKIQQDQKKGDLGNTVIDYGYALNPLACGFRDFGPIRKANHTMFHPKGYPQLSVQADPRGDINVFHAGYQDKPGAKKYHIGNLNTEPNLEKIVRTFIESDQTIKFEPSDVEFMDSFDHAIQTLLDQMKSDEQFGIPWSQRFIGG